VHGDKPSFRGETRETREEIMEWATGRGQLILVALAALVVLAFVLALAGV
jgi:hypothetical protein